MDITIVANDTRGGVEPYLALAATAASRGHAVRFVAPPQYEPTAAAAGIVRFVPLHGAQQAQEVAAAGRMSLREMSRRVVELTKEWAVDAAAGAAGTDVVISGIGGIAVARPVAEAVGAPFLRAHLQPLDAPSTRYPGPLAAPLGRLGPAGRLLSHTLTAVGTALLTRAPERAARSHLHLQGAPTAPIPTILYGFSGAIVPVRSDTETVRIATGYWSLPDSAGVDAQLREFVDQPGPVVSIGFGSMQTGDPHTLRRTVIAAARHAGARVVLITGWGALDQSGVDDDDVLTVASAPHTWLFPRMSATVHHGGAGTTGAALSAGKPTVVIPFGADQPFWAARAAELGVAPPPLSRKRLTEKALGEALARALTDTDMRERAARLGEGLRLDGGAVAAVEVLETVVL